MSCSPTSGRRIGWRAAGRLRQTGRIGRSPRTPMRSRRSTNLAGICWSLLQRRGVRGDRRSRRRGGAKSRQSRATKPAAASAACRPARATRSCARCLTFVCRPAGAGAAANDRTRSATSCAGWKGDTCRPGRAARRRAAWPTFLPTGRNFYAVDPRTLPSLAAWQVGQELAREVLERHRDETGGYPESVGISIWGTSAMRTHGDDVAEVLALLGVRPVWQKENRRVIGVEVIPLDELGRPRIDVTVRISGFFRDAFPHLIKLLDEAVQAVIDARRAARAELRPQALPGRSGAKSLPAARRASGKRRIASSAPSRAATAPACLPLIDERNWHDDADLAETYVNWGGYAYSRGRGRRRCPRGVSPPARPGRGRRPQPGQPRARHLRQRRLLPVPRRHDRHHPRPHRQEAAPLFRRHARPRPAGGARSQGRSAARLPHARRQSEMARKHHAARLQGRARTGRHRRLPVRLRRHRRRRRRLDVRASRAEPTRSIRRCRSFSPEQSLGLAGDHRAPAGSERARPVASSRGRKRWRRCAMHIWQAMRCWKAAGNSRLRRSGGEPHFEREAASGGEQS